MSDARKDGYHHNRYTVAKLARFVGVTPRTIERWYVLGKLPEPEYLPSGTKQWTPAQARAVLELFRKTDRKRRINKHG